MIKKVQYFSLGAIVIALTVLVGVFGPRYLNDAKGTFFTNYNPTGNGFGQIVLNEFGWTGTSGTIPDPSDQFLELRNMTNDDINFATNPLEVRLNGVRLIRINSGSIAAAGYFVVTTHPLGSSKLAVSDLDDPALVLRVDPGNYYELYDTNTNTLLDQIGVPGMNSPGVPSGDLLTYASAERHFKPYSKTSAALGEGEMASFFHTAVLSQNFVNPLDGIGTPGAENSFLKSLTVTSNNPDPALAKTGDIITIHAEVFIPSTNDFTDFANAELLSRFYQLPSQNQALRTNSSGSEWSIEYTVNGSEVSGPLDFELLFDYDGFSSIAIVAPTSGSQVTIDNEYPAISNVHIESNGIDPTLARQTQIATLTFTSDQLLSIPLSRVTISTILNTFSTPEVINFIPNTTYNYSVTHTFQLGGIEDEGVIPFYISAKDPTGNETSITATTDNSSVTFDRTDPVITANPNIGTTGDTTPPFNFLSSEGAVLTNLTGDCTTTTILPLTVSVAPTNNSLDLLSSTSTPFADGNYSCSFIVTDPAGNTTNHTFTFIVDTRPPTLVLMEIDQNNTQFAKTGQTLNLKMEFLTNTQAPVVTFWNQAPVTAVLSPLNVPTEWVATYTTLGSEPEGNILFTITYNDQMGVPQPGLSQTNLTGPNVIYDKTVPQISAFTMTNTLTNVIQDTFMDISTAPNNGVFSVSIDVTDPTPTSGPASGLSEVEVWYRKYDSDPQNYQFFGSIPVAPLGVLNGTFVGDITLTNNFLASDDYEFAARAVDRSENSGLQNNITIADVLVDIDAPMRGTTYTVAPFIGKNTAFVRGNSGIGIAWKAAIDDSDTDITGGIRNHPSYPEGIHHYTVSWGPVGQIKNSMDIPPSQFGQYITRYNNLPLLSSVNYEFFVTAVDLAGHVSVANTFDSFITSLDPNGINFPTTFSFQMSLQNSQAVLSFNETTSQSPTTITSYNFYIKQQGASYPGQPNLVVNHANLLGMRTGNIPGTHSNHSTHCVQGNIVGNYNNTTLGITFPLATNFTEICSTFGGLSGDGNVNYGDNLGNNNNSGGQSNSSTSGNFNSECAITFTDVPQNHPKANYIQEMCIRNIMTGYENATFGVGDPLKRSELAKILVQGLQKVPVTYENYYTTPPIFKDVPKKDSWENAITSVANSLGIMKGYKESQYKNFGPFIPAKKAEALKAIIDGLKLPKDIGNVTINYFDTFNDWQTQYIKIAMHYGMISSSTGNFYPNKPIERELVAEYIAKGIQALEALNADD